MPPILPSPDLKEVLPQGSIRVPIRWIIFISVLLVSVGIGWGGYKAGFTNQATAINSIQQDNKTLHDDFNALRYDMGQLKQSIDDLKDVLNHKK